MCHSNIHFHIFPNYNNLTDFKRKKEISTFTLVDVIKEILHVYILKTCVLLKYSLITSFSIFTRVPIKSPSNEFPSKNTRKFGS